MSSPNKAPSWGNYPDAPEQQVRSFSWRTNTLPATTTRLLPRGLGRSYGDVCLNDHGTLLDTSALSHLISFDASSGILRAESGLSFADLLAFSVPRGWFLPVTPGTKYVTLGGAIANDIHGKNHHGAGTIGRFIHCFELLRSTGERLLCDSQNNKELFSATIGGLGLTGLITWAEIQLIPIKSPLIDQEVIPFTNLNEFFAINDDSDQKFAYTVAWLDTTSKRFPTGRGIFFRGNHALGGELPSSSVHPSKVAVPFFAPAALLNPVSMQLFNQSYFTLQSLKKGTHSVHYEPFFYPLDSVRDWNKLYGQRGFLQYQFVVPRDSAPVVLTELLRIARETGTVSFLSVLKTFGDLPSPGILSFPRPGITLAMDVRQTGQKTLDTLDRFDDIILAHGGRLYPAKDGRMSAKVFQTCYPELEQFIPQIDPAFSSQFWRRVMP